LTDETRRERMAQQRGSREIPPGLKKDWKKLAQAMRSAGWTFEPGRGHAVKAFAPDGETAAVLPGTPGDWRAIRNEIAKFRRWCRGRGVDPGI
jgi:hypothetical protein